MTPIRRLSLAALLCGCHAATFAHPGHGVAGLDSGLAHPFAADHLLAIVAVGAWSVAVLPAGRRLAGPLVFLLALLVGAVAGAAGLASPLVELGVAVSAALFGALLVAPRALPAAGALALVAAAALLHGLAHGAELPAGAGFAGYAAGMLITTTVLQAIGLALGTAIDRVGLWAWRAAAIGLGAAGLLLIGAL